MSNEAGEPGADGAKRELGEENAARARAPVRQRSRALPSPDWAAAGSRPPAPAPPPLPSGPPLTAPGAGAEAATAGPARGGAVGRRGGGRRAGPPGRLSRLFGGSLYSRVRGSVGRPRAPCGADITDMAESPPSPPGTRSS